MTIEEQSAMLDAEDRPIEATQAYEKAAAKPDANIDTFLNLAVLYFVCTDGGYLAHHQLQSDFVDNAWKRANELLDEAELRLGAESEVQFWRRYFSFIVLGDDLPVEECERLANSGTSLVPFFYLFNSYGGSKYKEQAQQLYEAVKDGTTAKKRYIRSLLEGKVKL